MKNALVLIAAGLAVALSGCAHATAVNSACHVDPESAGVASAVHFPLGSGDRLGQELFNDYTDSAATPMTVQTASSTDLQY